MLSEQQLTKFLQQKFGYESFRPGQLDVVTAVMNGQNTLAVLPTGAGKTLLYQLPGYLMNGSVVIVSPLLSLMQDQVARLRSNGEKSVTMLSSLQSVSQRQATLAHLSQFRFIFASPEILAQQNVSAALQRISVSLFVVDEAHCVSQWGPNFRPHYLMLKGLIQHLGKPTTLMLTATATKRVQRDILDKLGLDKQSVKSAVRSVNRENIFMAVKKLRTSEAKNQELLELVTQLTGPGIIYFSSRKQATQIAGWLQEQTGLAVAAYHAGIDQTARYKIQHQFMQNKLQIICATSAFGMGIDKDDIRFVIHYHLCANLENYVQEIGRAGRDGNQSIAILLYCDGDERIPQRLNQLTIPSPQVVIDFVSGRVTVDQLGESGELLSFYVSAGWNAERINQSFIERKQQEKEQLNAMLQYIMSEHCRRNLVLAYFYEATMQHDDGCCDGEQTEWSAATLGLQRENEAYIVPPKGQFNWLQQLDSLFFENS